MSIQNSVISGTGGTNDGIHNLATYGPVTVTVTSSQITGYNSTIYSDTSTCTPSRCLTQIGGSQLAGGGVQGGGTYQCVYSYKGDYATLGSNCK